jgi:NitT/TauT family transport system permease protein
VAETGQLTAATAAPAATRPGTQQAQSRNVILMRVLLIGGIFAFWEISSRTGLVLRDIVPPVSTVLVAVFNLLSQPDNSPFSLKLTLPPDLTLKLPPFYWHLWVTTYEAAGAMAIGTAAGLVTGLALGVSLVLSRMFEPYIYYVSPTPRIILFPIMLMLFGVGPESKIALGALATFFPVALTTAAGMRGIDKVLIRVGKSFRASQVQMATKIYLPAMREPVLNGIRLGFGFALITVLLAETKLSKEGLGFMLMQIYQRFDMASLYALLIIVFAISAVCSALMARVAGVRT